MTTPIRPSTTTGPTFVDAIPGYNPQEIMVSEIPGVQSRKGAPVSLRAAVAAVRRPAQKLAILRKVDPNAQPTGDGNFVYTPPGATESVLFDPKGFKDWGKDIVEGFPLVAEVMGSIGGGALGLAGGVPGAIAGAGLGGAAARDITEQGMMAVTGTEDPRSLGQRVTDVGITAGASALGEGGGRLVGGVVGKAVGNRLAPRAATTAVQESARRLEVPLTAGMATGRRFLQNVEAGMAANPITHGTMLAAAERATSAAKRASDDIVRTMARGSDTSPGSFAGALRAAGRSRIEEFRNIRLGMDNALKTVIPDGTLIPLDNVQSLMNDLQAVAMKSPEALGPEVAQAITGAQRILTDAQELYGGQIPFDILRRFRSTIGEASRQGGFGAERTPSAAQYLERLQSAIGADMRQGANLLDQMAMQKGLQSPGALQALELHDEYVRINRDADALVNLDTMEKLMGVSPSNPSQWAITVTRHPETAKALRDTIPPDQWDTIAGTIVEDLGRAADSAVGQDETWSPQRFLTRWKALRPQGREALFGGTRYANIVGPLNDLANVAEAMQDIGRLSNTSNTARALMANSLISKALIAPIAMAAGVGGATGGLPGASAGGAVGAAIGGAGILSTWAASKLLTNPTAVRAIVAGARSARSTGAAAPGFLTRLVTIGRSDPELQSAINEYIAAIGQAGYPLPDPMSVQQLNTGSPAVQFTPR